ncbi:MAG: hypothetical protein E7001_03800, partial [Coriobacteriaceae bacterium]|nr:hypothetical protein [Coriobacteriaceae bacterium]
MSRSRSAAALLAALLAISPVMQPMAAYAEAQRQGELGAPVAAPEDLLAKPQGALDAEEDPAEDRPLQTPPLPEDGEDRAALEQGAPVEEGAAEAREGLSDTPSSDQSMAYSWRYEGGALIESEDNGAPGTSFRSNRVTLPEGATGWGIDVSYANGPVDWKQVKRSGVDFAVLRLGYGWGGDDAQFLNNVAGARANGIKIGVYLYSYAWDAASARREAQWTLQVLRKAGLKPSDLDLPVFYDIENVSKVSGKPAGVDDDNRYREITGGPAAFASMASAYCEVVKAAGYTPGVYSSTSWWETYLTSPVFDQWDRWVAQWNDTNTYKGSYTMWQYSSDGQVAGVKGRVDVNYSYSTAIGIPEKASPGWHLYSNTWYYYSANGSRYSGWLDLAGTLYHLSASGAMDAGWFSEGGSWYWAAPSGELARGWRDFSGTPYYF